MSPFSDSQDGTLALPVVEEGVLIALLDKKLSDLQGWPQPAGLRASGDMSKNRGRIGVQWPTLFAKV